MYIPFTDDSNVRQWRADKEKADLLAEKERLAREVEMLTQRANVLQRQVDKLQVISTNKIRKRLKNYYKVQEEIVTE